MSPTTTTTNLRRPQPVKAAYQTARQPQDTCRLGLNQLQSLLPSTPVYRQLPRSRRDPQRALGRAHLRTRKHSSPSSMPRLRSNRGAKMRGQRQDHRHLQLWTRKSMPSRIPFLTTSATTSLLAPKCRPEQATAKDREIAWMRIQPSHPLLS